MKKVIILITVLLLAGVPVSGRNKAMRIIFDTDMGNDVDDALAMDMLYKYAERKQIKLLGVMTSKGGRAAAEYVDILNTWYGRKRTPIGVVRNGAESYNGINYAVKVCQMKDAEGKPLFKRTLKDYAKLPDAERLYRKLLARQPDSSVTVIVVGFSTNIARLMQTGPDKYSPLNGRQLMARKVARLVMMGGRFNKKRGEFNIYNDVASAKKVLEECPVEIVTSPWEVGQRIVYPGRSIAEDFSWTKHHPVVEGYEAFRKMPYDRPAWDQTAVLYAVEGGRWFGLSQRGTMTVDAKGVTTLHEDSHGNRRYLTVTKEQCAAIKSYLVRFITSMPEYRRGKD